MGNRISSNTPRTSYQPREPEPNEADPSNGRVDDVPEAPTPVGPTNGSVLSTLKSKALAEAYIKWLGLVPDAAIGSAEELRLTNEFQIGSNCLRTAETEANAFFDDPAGVPRAAP